MISAKKEMERGSSSRNINKRKKIVKRVRWADEVGGDLIAIKGDHKSGDSILPGCEINQNQVRDGGVIVATRRGKGLDASIRSEPLGPVRTEEHSINSIRPVPCSYKEVLLRGPRSRSCAANLKPHFPKAPLKLESAASWRLAGRCFRCLASGYKVADCRDPVRCLRYRKSGHRAHFCKEEERKTWGRMNRVYRQRERTPRVYIPYTEEYLRRRELRRNAVLADVIPPANLGTDPLQTIAFAMARRFGGYTEDFAVARYRDRGYVIFLPEWVSAEVLARREVLTLNGFWIRCYTWGQYRNARPHRVSYSAWIRLINLLFECWTVA